MEQKYNILIVDDAEINRSMLADMLADEYSVLEAADGMEAIAVLEKKHSDISLVLLDIIMPEMDGFEVLSIMEKGGWLKNVPVIIISAETSSAYIDRAYDLGATDYLSRPFDEKTVCRRVKNTIMLYAKQKMLEEMVTDQIFEKERNNFLMVEILSNIVEFRNRESGLHVLHIRTITELLLRHLIRITDQYVLTPTQIALIVNASALHDVGKISIPEEILNKPGRLTAEEFEVIKTHCIMGAQILKNAPYCQDEELVEIAHDICRWHHERYDGGGYPDGLIGDEIPIAAQVVSLADVYDALTSERVYKPAYSHETAMQMILAGECGQFNPVLMQCLTEVGSGITEELSKRTGMQISEAEIKDISAQLLSSGKVSSRTLALLEQERVKYRFFASMSNEIQFEYNFGTELLTLSDWGANHLHLGEIISHPIHNAELHKVFSYENIQDLYDKLKNTGKDNPIVEEIYSVNINGTSRWYKAIARPLWVSEETLVMSGVIGKFIDIHEEYLQLESLKKKAEQDSLTKLLNHVSARSLIEKALENVYIGKYAFILLDIDLFKAVNDQYGHLFGDELLKNVAHRIAGAIRKEDIAARIGGDEFLIFITGQNDMEPVIENLFHAITAKYKEFDVSVSMGVVICPQAENSYDALFQRADQALYSAKNNGRNQYCFYSSSLKNTLSLLSDSEAKN